VSFSTSPARSPFLMVSMQARYAGRVKKPCARLSADRPDRGRSESVERGSPEPSLVSRRSLFVSLCGMVFLVNLARIVFAPLLEPLKAAFAVGDGAVGLLATLAWVGSALPRIPVGYLLTRLRRRTVVLGSGLLLTGAAALAAAAPTIEWLYAGALGMGLASGAYFIAGNPLVSELFPDRVGAALGVHGGASQVAAVLAAPLVGVVLAGVLADPLSWEPWRTVLRAIALAAAASTLVLWWVSRWTTLPEAGAEDRDLLGAARRQWRIVLAGVAFIGATGFVYNGVFNFYVTYLVQAKGLGAPAARNLLTLLFLAGLPAFVVSGRLADRLPNVPYVLAIGGAFAGCLLALTAVSGVVALALASAAMGWVIHSLFPAMDTYLLDGLPDENRASAYAVYSGTMMLIQATGSVTVGTLREAGYGFDVLYSTLAGGLVVFVLVLVALYLDGRLPAGGVPAR